MPRVARIAVPGVPHHVTQRGNNQQQVFFGDDDRRIYLARLREHAAGHGLAILGYCLMPNHVHLVVVPEHEQSLAKGIGRTHLRYTQYVNRAYERNGHLWQNRFFSCGLDEAHCWVALRYIEYNPVRTGLVDQAWDYSWSSAAAHVGRPDSSRILDLTQWSLTWDAQRWREWLAAGEDDAGASAVREYTHSGRPLGAAKFVEELERVLGRRFAATRRGRPRGQ
jgi:putative transposase